jgi:uncharacterized surface protein with fasciclin (FAS1) repeats
MIRSSKLLLSVFALLLAFTACQKESLNDLSSTNVANNLVAADDRSGNTVVDIAVSNPDFSTLVAAVLKTNTAGFFGKNNLGTVFAPTNAAFAQLPVPFNNAANISAITEPKDIDFLTKVLRYHAITGSRTAAQLPNGSYQTYKTSGAPQGGLLFVSRNAAGEVFINGNSKVVAADIQASNAVIHVLDKVLFFPTRDIFQIARTNGNFTALVAALQKAGLANVMSSPFTQATVFAPTDAAFAQLPAPLNNADNIRGITDPATIATLRSVLLYHVVGGSVFSADLRENLSAPTLLASNNVTITLAGGPKVKGNSNPSGSNIVLTDLLAINGTIHVIDSVLLP